MQRGRQADGIALITQVMQAQERRFINELSYTVDLTEVGFNAENQIPSEDGFYQVSARACPSENDTARCIEAIAVPQGPQVGSGILGLSSFGEQNIYKEADNDSVIQTW
ncbi:type IV pilin protein [Marinibactrum halimedae]|nr:type IV pilin protein [Marinibactrum halimedae]